uniref:Uncharacterized protein n=1 Tax=Nelumbo nucifera TaxID=4432 RepID=A0A822Y8L0_NELNU|nr:TPA_asm: hypothetical protein HUJ06_027406 [Nelumbo nucifera]
MLREHYIPSSQIMECIVLKLQKPLAFFDG